MEERRDWITRKDGRMMLVRNGKMMPLDLDMTLEDGTKVMTTGALMRPDGTSRQMLDGEVINMAGEMSNVDDEAYIRDTRDLDDMTRFED